MKLDSLLENKRILIALGLLLLVLLRQLLIEYRYYAYSYSREDMGDMLKPVNDVSQLRYLKLFNGLQILLISDPNSSRQGAALTVDVGSCFE